MSKLVIKIFTR